MIGCLWGGIRFLSGIDIFSRNNVYYVSYPSIDGIQTATPITIQGVKVGTVTAIEFNPAVSRRVRLELMVKRAYPIPADSKARIYNDGLMGGKAISIDMGRSERMLAKYDTLAPEQTVDLMNVAGGELMEVKRQLMTTLSTLDATLSTLNSALADNRPHIDGTLRHLDGIAASMDEVLSAEKGKLGSLIGNLERFSGALGDNAGRIDSLMADLDAFSSQLAAARVDALSAELQRTLGALNEALEGDGTLGRVMHDERLYASLSEASANLAALLEDLKAHPKRYVHFSLFGAKDKSDKEAERAAKAAAKAEKRAAKEAAREAREQ